MENVSKAARMMINSPNALQLYSAPTPNGMKVAIVLEEIAFIKSTDQAFSYEPHSIDLRHNESREQDYLEICPNGKIPAIVDPNGGGPGKPIKLFESGAILLYLAEKYDCLMPREPILKAETIKWLFWGSASVSPAFKTFGFYYRYCPHNMNYCRERYRKSCDRLLSVLESQLSHSKHWVVGDVYTIADISIWPWLYALLNNYGDAGSNCFSNFDNYPKVRTWYDRCNARAANQRSLLVCPYFS